MHVVANSRKVLTLLLSSSYCACVLLLVNLRIYVRVSSSGGGSFPLKTPSFPPKKKERKKKRGKRRERKKERNAWWGKGSM